MRRISSSDLGVGATPCQDWDLGRWLRVKKRPDYVCLTRCLLKPVYKEKFLWAASHQRSLRLSGMCSVAFNLGFFAYLAWWTRWLTKQYPDELLCKLKYSHLHLVVSPDVFESLAPLYTPASGRCWAAWTALAQSPEFENWIYLFSSVVICNLGSDDDDVEDVVDGWSAT